MHDHLFPTAFDSRTTVLPLADAPALLCHNTGPEHPDRGRASQKSGND